MSEEKIRPIFGEESHYLIKRETPTQELSRLRDENAQLRSHIRQLEADNERLRKVEAAVIDRVLQRVAELPDRTSPENWPEAMLVTDNEMREILTEELAYTKTVFPSREAILTAVEHGVAPSEQLSERESRIWTEAQECVIAVVLAALAGEDAKQTECSHPMLQNGKGGRTCCVCGTLVNPIESNEGEDAKLSASSSSGESSKMCSEPPAPICCSECGTDEACECSDGVNTKAK